MKTSRCGGASGPGLGAPASAADAVCAPLIHGGDYVQQNMALSCVEGVMFSTHMSQKVPPQVLYEDSQMIDLGAPYIAGFLGFREAPCLAEAVHRLEQSDPSCLPQVIFVDGNGLFHYREFGLACHLGVLAGLPCIGVAKNLLQVDGMEDKQEHQHKISLLQKGGDSFPLKTRSGRVLGQALRSSDKSTKPIYVSVGHRISLDTALRLTHACCKYRVPEPIRQYRVAGEVGA
nr:PREDICTED: endonuclease V isoform X2 [Lepisosteus oculatus]